MMNKNLRLKNVMYYFVLCLKTHESEAPKAKNIKEVSEFLVKKYVRDEFKNAFKECFKAKNLKAFDKFISNGDYYFTPPEGFLFYDVDFEHSFNLAVYDKIEDSMLINQVTAGLVEILDLLHNEDVFYTNLYNEVWDIIDNMDD